MNAPTLTGQELADPEIPAAPPLRALILSARFGGGHKSAADALSASWKRLIPGGNVSTIDYYDEFVSPFVTNAADIGYTQSVRLFPKGYEIFYRVTRDLKPESSAQKWLNNIGRKELEEYLAGHQADVIVGVHPTPCGALSNLRLEGKLHCPVVTVITDYTVHNQWIHPGTDLYLVGSELVRQGLIGRGVPAEKLIVTGIPIRVNTGLLEQRELLREKWGLKPDKPTVLVMTGAQGMMRRPWRLFQAIASRPVQGFFLCGKDRALLARLRLLSHRYPDFRIMPFVRVVPELMCVSDILISKAGGLTTSEALAMELPMVIFHPIPGQEYANRDYLVHAGAAISANRTRELGAALDFLCANPGKLKEMRAAIHEIRRPHAADDAVRETVRLVEEKWRWNSA
jgi:processive 1,2-diacylglycerol beta-glucosyltransferase